MSYNTELAENNAALRAILEQAQSLPDKDTGGGAEPYLTYLQGMVSRTITEIELDVDGVGVNAFRNCNKLTKAIFPNATYVNGYGFYACQLLETVYMPKVTRFGSYAFTSCRNLKGVDFPLATSGNTNLFQGCTYMETVNMPLVGKLDNGFFENCFYIESLDFHRLTSIGLKSLGSCHSLKRLILRNTEIANMLSSESMVGCDHFDGTQSDKNPTGAKDGYIYVPRELVSSYQTATNWNLWSTQFRALEDYTVDGTIMGALDDTKVNGGAS